MKHFALVTAFAFLAAVPASAAEMFKPAPAMTPVRQSQQAIPQFVKNLDPVPRCYTLHGNSCWPSGATQACTDACNYDLSCSCRDYFYNMTYIGSYWICDYEC